VTAYRECDHSRHLSYTNTQDQQPITKE
jgi:hypothetical protein